MSQHPKTKTPSDADLKGNPGIGSSKGAGGDKDRIGGDNSFEGDVMNDVTPQGGVDPDHTGRTNK
jgi:hypothetical protein